MIGGAPIFDNGLSLLCYAMEDDFEGDYVNTRMPSTYVDFITFIKPLMTNRQKQMVRKLTGFKFDTNTTYKLPSKRLKSIEKVIQNQINRLLS